MRGGGKRGEVRTPELSGLLLTFLILAEQTPTIRIFAQLTPCAPFTNSIDRKAAEARRYPEAYSDATSGKYT